MLELEHSRRLGSTLDCHVLALAPNDCVNSPISVVTCSPPYGNEEGKKPKTKRGGRSVILFVLMRIHTIY